MSEQILTHSSNLLLLKRLRAINRGSRARVVLGPAISQAVSRWAGSTRKQTTPPFAQSTAFEEHAVMANPQLEPSSSRQGRVSRAPKRIQLLLCAELLLGRAPGPGGVALQSAKFHGMVSRRHASIKYLSSTSQWVVKDLNSTNGVHVNGKRIPSNEATPISDGDMIRFGLNTDLNELMYRFINDDKGPPMLSRCSNKPTPQCELRLQHAQRAKRQRSPDLPASRWEEDPIGPVPTPEVGGAARKHPNNVTVRAGSTGGSSLSSRSTSPLSTEEVLPPPPSKKACTNTSLSATEVLHSRKVLSSTTALSAEELDSPSCTSGTHTQDTLSSTSSTPIQELLHTPSCKKVFTLDSLFDTSKSDTTTNMDDAIFGKTPTLTPRARAVLMGVNVSPIEIQVQIARDEVEKEKNKLESKYQVLKSELAAKDRQLKERREKEAKVSVAVEQEFICAICQELFIRSLTLACSHSFCEWCFKQWIGKRGLPECPVCRTVTLQQPVRSIAIDNVIKRHIANMSRKQQAARKRVERQHMAALGLASPSSQESLDQSSGPSSLGSQSVPIMVDSPDSVTVVSDDEEVVIP